MENKDIQRLLDFIAHSTLDEVSIETSDLKLKVKRYGYAPTVVQTVATAQANPVFASPTQDINTSAEGQVPSLPVAISANRVTIKSPMIGTFYTSAGPDKPMFVQVGSDITKGKTVCIIEAMKLFNEIEAEISGRIVEILVQNATPVEYDQPLFVVEV